MTMQDRDDHTLRRWRARASQRRQIVCLGDSITHGPVGPVAVVRNAHGWVDQLARALENASGPRPGDGFRGLWRGQEWSWSGSWTKTALTDPFDVAPFGCGFYSSG